MLLNYAKYVFGAPEVTFLGYAVFARGTQPLPEKVEAIRTFPRPESVKELRQFLGMLNFYRRFVPAAAKSQAPLNAALQGNAKVRTPIEWTLERVAAFDGCVGFHGKRSVTTAIERRVAAVSILYKETNASRAEVRHI